MLDSDPSIRWQALRDLVHAPTEVVAVERAQVAIEGWGARLLALQGEDGQWGGSSGTAGVTAGRSTARFALRSRPRSESWKGCWRMSALPVARRNPSRLDAGVRRISSNESCSGARAPAKSSTRPGCNSHFQ